LLPATFRIRFYRGPQTRVTLRVYRLPIGYSDGSIPVGGGQVRIAVPTPRRPGPVAPQLRTPAEVEICQAAQEGISRERRVVPGGPQPTMPEPEDGFLGYPEECAPP